MKSVRTAMYVGAAALLIAIYPWGAQGFEGYYTGLRFLICGICIFTAYVSLRERSALAFPFLLVGLIFNPFVPAHANREFWIAADVIVAGGFLATTHLALRFDAAKAATFPLIEPIEPSEAIEQTGGPEVETVEISS
ncbi:MAG: hypothetical protein JRH10_09280 [Deltaproteobacteria bacterium]|nr:hypothetical protein [Deltaproteobacteria bacterium]